MAAPLLQSEAQKMIPRPKRFARRSLRAALALVSWLPVLSTTVGWGAEPLLAPSRDRDDVVPAESAVRQADAQRVEVEALRKELARLEARLAALRPARPASPTPTHPTPAELTPADADRFADAALFHKGVAWALRYADSPTTNDVALIKKSLVRGTERAQAIADGTTPWTKKTGRVARGFTSVVDGSIQPYGLVIPQSYDGRHAMRLDVVLHGSSKPVGMSELNFIARFDEADADPSAVDADYIELHPLGRVENCYRWAGETDVFEAIDAVCRNYAIDRDRIVLRGMSMGASGAWHLGLKRPDRFVAIGPYCGYVDTHRFSEAPLAHFVKVGPLPPRQELGLHMLDSVDYAANGGVVPVVGAMGEHDPFFQAHVIMGEAFAKEGLQLVNLISPGTGHQIDPVVHGEQLRLLGEHAAKGLDRDPQRLRFVTWTLKYNRCHWLELLGLGMHYERANFQARVTGDDGIEVVEWKNVTRFAIHRPLSTMRIDGVDIALPPHQPHDALSFRKSNEKWHCEGLRSQIALQGKRPGLQGPIDDAFATPFLCVRGTGQPWHAEINDWSAASLRRFEHEWARYMRGSLPVKDDREVTEADVRDKHLVLFGDPGSNSWIAKALPQLPISWTRDAIRLHDQSQSSRDHVPVLICASPLAAHRYLVVNSGHTFHEAEFSTLNYLLFPRLGDWALIKVLPGAVAWQPPSSTIPAEARVFPEAVIDAGYFDETFVGRAQTP